MEECSHWVESVPQIALSGVEKRPHKVKRLPQVMRAQWAKRFGISCNSPHLYRSITSTTFGRLPCHLWRSTATGELSYLRWCVYFSAVMGAMGSCCCCQERLVQNAMKSSKSCRKAGDICSSCKETHLLLSGLPRHNSSCRAHVRHT